jgi:hypothetical protein
MKEVKHCTFHLNFEKHIFEKLNEITGKNNNKVSLACCMTVTS